MVEYRIREARISDIPGLYSTMRSTTYAQFRYGDIGFEQTRAKLIEELFKPKQVRVFVAVVACTEGEECVNGERVVGYTIMAPYASTKKESSPVHVEFEGKTYDLSGYAYSWGTGIHKEYRGHGIAPALRLYAHGAAKQTGFKGYVTTVDAHNKSSIAVQEKVGMIKIAEIPDEKRKSGIDQIWAIEF